MGQCGFRRLSDIVALCMILQSVTASFIPSGDRPFSGRQRLGLTRYGNDRLGGPIEPSDDAGNDDLSRKLFLHLVFTQKVKEASELCPPQIVRLFILTKNEDVFRLCMREQNETTTNVNTVDEASAETSSESEEEKKSFTPFSAHVLKRILQNIDDGTVKVDLPYTSADVKDKRSRLSIHSALTSLADMVRQDLPSRNRKPKYGFHSKLLKMG